MPADTHTASHRAQPLVLPGPEPRAAGERIAPWQVRAAIARMRADLAAPLTLADLAAAAGVSTFHFARAFRNAVGEPPLRHRARLRIREACRLLAETDGAIGAIAAQVGYRSPQAFARAFERLCGCAPSLWRARRGDPARYCGETLADTRP